MLLARLPLITAALLALSLISAISWQSYEFYKQQYSVKDTKALSAIPVQNFKKDIKKPSHNIASFKLFGDATYKPKPVQAIPKNLPKTKLKLTLTGVMTSKKEDEASALIQGPDKNTLYYKVNDELPGGAILKQVHEDRVVVERSGRLENLIFIEKKSIGIETYNDYRDEEEQQASTTQPKKAPQQKAKANPARTQGIKERLNKLRQKMLKNRPST